MKKAISFITFGLISLAAAFFLSATGELNWFSSIKLVGFDGILTKAFSSYFVITLLIMMIDLFFDIDYLIKKIEEQLLVKTVLNAVLLVLSIVVTVSATMLYLGEFSNFTFLVFKGSILIYPVLRGLYFVIAFVIGIINKAVAKKA